MRRMTLSLLLILLASIAAACGGGGGSGSGRGKSSDLFLIDIDVAESTGVALNRILEFEFSHDLDPETVRPDTIRIQQGPNFGRQVPGEFHVTGDVVRFFPRLPVLPDLSDAGLQAGTTYRISLPGMPDVATVRSDSRDRLRKARKVVFGTAGQVGLLFSDNFIDAAPPAVTSVSPAHEAEEVPANTEITLTFKRRPLHPAMVTTTNIHLTLVERDGIVLERPVAGRPVLRQTHDLVQVVWEPTFPLAARATYRLVVERRLTDLIGIDAERFESEFTTRDEAARPGEMVLDFTPEEGATLADEAETTASWSDTVPDALSALFTAAGGDGTAGDFNPQSDVDISADDFDRGVSVQTIGGVETDVVNFRSLTIPEGVKVRFRPRTGGTNRPMMLLSLKPIEINGVLDVSGAGGSDGEIASTTSAILLARGGVSGPGGGAGADNYTGSLTTTQPNQDGGDVESGGGGGRGGGVSSQSSFNYAGGGGGGGARESGLDGSAGGYTTTSWNGAGGKGGFSEEERGQAQNEVRVPNVGGAGGAAGANGYYRPTSTNWRHGAGSGGGGGGAIALQSAGDVTVGATGVIRAPGGDGGGTAKNSFYYGGAGGGGAGGSVLIRATGNLTFATGSALDVAGGGGGPHLGTFSRYAGGQGGAGGSGYIRLEAREDENAPGKPLIGGLNGATLTYDPVSEGLFSPRGGGAPSIGRIHFVNLGVFDPEMLKPARDDIAASLFNDEMTIEVQMATEDPNDLGAPDLRALDTLDADTDGETDDTLDPDLLSEWTRVQEIETLNGRGYQFLRIRVTFQLDDDHGPDDPLPFIERLRIPYSF